MREQRMSLCQTLRQYVFVHLAILEGSLDIVDELNETPVEFLSPLPTPELEICWSHFGALFADSSGSPWDCLSDLNYSHHSSRMQKVAFLIYPSLSCPLSPLSITSQLPRG